MRNGQGMGSFLKGMNALRRVSLLCVFLCIAANAQSVENVMQEYNRKNDLSQKTIDENKGHLVLFGRE